MKTILKMAWRSLLRNKRRSIITGAAIAFAVFLSIFMRTMQIGTYDYNIQRSVEMFSGYLQVQKEGYNESPGVRKAIKLTDDQVSKIENTENVIAGTKRISGFGLVGRKSKSVGAAIIGINPDTEKEVSTLHERLKDGEWVGNDRPLDIVVGYKMLNNLDAEIGDTVVALVNSYDGSMGNMKLRISGTMKIGQDEFDKMSCVMNLQTADELFAMYGKYHNYTVRLNDLDNAEQAKSDIASIFPEDSEKAVLDWQELMPELVQGIELDNISGIIMMFILVVIVAFGVLNTITMSITERYNEFGVMLAIGTKKSFLMLTVFLETVILTILSIIGGLIPGVALSNYMNMNPIVLSGAQAESYTQVGFEPVMITSTDPAIYANISLLIFITVITVFAVPAVKLSRLEALKGIRYT